MKISKRILSILLCVLIVMSLGVFSFAKNQNLSERESEETLCAQWEDGKGPKKSGYAIDYKYFSPITKENDTEKYPLVVYLPGNSHNNHPGDELSSYFFLWSSREYQAKFKNASGAYLLAARAHGERGLEWNSPLLMAPLKAAIDDFAKKNPNVDTKRIYVIGGCYGATGAINFSAKYPSTVAACIAMSPSAYISSVKARNMKNVPVWLLSAKHDPIFGGLLVAPLSYYNLKHYGAKGVEKVRVTLDKAPSAGNFRQHDSWKLVFFDMDTNACGGYGSFKTSSSTRGSLDSYSIIEQLSSYSK